MFTKDDFHKHHQQLNVIINDALGWKPLTNFRELSPIKKKVFNQKLNEYIQGLPTDFQTKILNDFNLICQLKIFDEMRPEEHHVRELNMESETLLTPEQKEWLDAGAPVPVPV